MIIIFTPQLVSQGTHKEVPETSQTLSILLLLTFWFSELPQELPIKFCLQHSKASLTSPNFSTWLGIVTAVAPLLVRIFCVNQLCIAAIKIPKQKQFRGGKTYFSHVSEDQVLG